MIGPYATANRYSLLSNLALLIAISLSPGWHSSTLAQSSGPTTGSIVGTVRDTQDAVLVGATITARRIETNLIRTAQTDSNGNYRLIQLPPGNYEIKAEANNFSSQSEKLTLTIGTTALADFTLSAGGSSEIIEVRAAGGLDEGKTESSTVIDRQRIDGLPINRRNFLDFSLTVARVLPDAQPRSGATATSDLSFNGQSARSNNLTIDGLDNNDRVLGSVRSTFSQEAVQEFQVISDSYSAEFGRALAGLINIVTKGGGNEFHGNLFLFNRNDTISARNAFASSNPPYSQYQFGSTLSGPIKRDRAFFFMSFERLSIKQNKIVTISNETVAAARRQGFAIGNGPEPFSVSTISVLGRVDARLTPNDTIWARYNFGGTYNGDFDDFGGLTDETNGGAQRLKDNSIGVDNTYFSNRLNLINETRFLYGRRNQVQLPLADGPDVLLQAPEGQDFFGRSTTSPQSRQERIYQIVDNVTLIRGRNQIKFGVDFQHFYTPPGTTALSIFNSGLAMFQQLDFSALANVPNLPFFTGLQAFDPALRTPEQIAFLKFLAGNLPTVLPGFPPGVPLDRLGLPFIYVQAFGKRDVETAGTLLSLFFQNDIKLEPNLLIKAGLRYDINRLRFTPDNNGNFSPRIALSYRPARLPKLNVRAAYGLFFAVPPTAPSFTVQASNSNKIAVIPFPFSVLPFALPRHHFPESEQLPQGVNFIPQLTGVAQYQPDLRSSYAQQVSTGFDYLIGNNTEVSLSYSFIRGIKLFSVRDINPVVRPIVGDPLNSIITGRIDPSRGNIFEFESAFDSYYHGLTISINRRLADRIGFLAHYTYSKAIDDTFDINPVGSDVKAVNPLRPGDERGLSIQDARHHFVVSGIWDLSYTKNRLLRDFQLSEILNLTSGRPFNLFAGVDLNMNGDIPPADRPVIGGVSLGRNLGVEPGFASLDLRLQRTVTIKDRYRLQGFAEAFNFFNRVNIDGVDTLFPPDAQGHFHLPPKRGGRYIATPDRYRGSLPPRQFQFGFRLTF